ncbi:MAG: hypothetical protein J4F28_06965 [Nitrosopumilaceae archaeon]|nr:hypothetical protein [Nitrosopumilaceae archaeon]
MKTISTREYPHDVERVFDALLSILDKSYNINSTDKTVRCVEVSLGMSLLSWGETFEVIVVAQNNGSAVRVRAKPRIFWNVTSNVEGEANKLLDLLEEDLDQTSA